MLVELVGQDYGMVRDIMVVSYRCRALRSWSSSWGRSRTNYNMVKYSVFCRCRVLRSWVELVGQNYDMGRDCGFLPLSCVAVVVEAVGQDYDMLPRHRTNHDLDYLTI